MLLMGQSIGTGPMVALASRLSLQRSAFVVLVDGASKAGVINPATEEVFAQMPR